jgi:uncharacterized protein
MQWRGRRLSSNVEDRRGLGGLAFKGGGVGCGGLLLILLISLLTGVNPLELLQDGGGSPATEYSDPQYREDAAPEDETALFVRTVLAHTEDAWREIFEEAGQRYQEPRLVLFSDQVSSACGFNSAAVGPFYCPGDGQIYLDLSFFRALDQRFGAPGDFAQAYVIAHEVGHHVQNLLGISSQVHRRQQQLGRAEANQLSVRLELQADCFAGVWGNRANRERTFLEPGDVQEGLAAAAAIGDDVLQRRSTGRVAPESWTHGSSEMRTEWFRRGFESGNIDACNTFSDGSPVY